MDFFALEPQLMERLTSRVKVKDQPIDVYAVDEVQIDANDEPKPLRVPCLLLSYDDYTVPEATGIKARLAQSWTVIVVVANVRGAGRAEARAESQALVDQVIAACLGWKPQTVDERPFAALQMINPSLPVSYGKQNSYFPFSFSTERVVVGART